MSDTTPPPGLVGAHHPDTAREAAEGSRWANLDHREMILVKLLLAGERGVTAAEVGKELGIGTQLAGSRLIELRGEGSAYGKFPRLATRSEDKRALPGQRPGRIHHLNDEGRKVAIRLARQYGFVDEHGYARSIG